jgi:hypothetical protein
MTIGKFADIHLLLTPFIYVFYVSMWFHFSFYFLQDLLNKKAAYRVPISRFIVHFLTMIATSFHGIAKSFCATTK